jgi:hypothetical protein
MRERLLVTGGADLSRVYFCDDGGTVHDVLPSSVFHWDDLSAADVADIARGGDDAMVRAAVVGVSVAELLAAWQLVREFEQLAGVPVGRVPLCCPVCGGDDVDSDGSEIAEPGTVTQWNMCHECATTWEDVYVLAARAYVRPGDDDGDDPICRECQYPASDHLGGACVVPPTVGAADWIDAAYEDANGCGVEL